LIIGSVESASKEKLSHREQNQTGRHQRTERVVGEPIANECPK
jgi:hypothetical protein